MQYILFVFPSHLSGFADSIGNAERIFTAWCT